MLKENLNWMRKVHPAPEDVVQLWEDYEYFFFIGHAPLCYSTRMTQTSAHCILSQSPGLLQLLCIALLLSYDFVPLMTFIRLLFHGSWIELRSVISYLRSIIGKDKEMFGNLLYHLRNTSFAGEIFPWPSVCQGLVHRVICIGKDTVHAHYKLNDLAGCVASMISLWQSF
ncbi:hypothetical protein BDP27DRAFT_488235 [Rhodocollybia butyracea]|uniref:Uncharacterized protein n=1 Tax=Rhodocollybia butyracea TaxID=206335 RepID=A0A9P5UFY4_9AGAR|nr:hypothetical protein BDP27DRAFT_488235 [Rhodocollybia butyracea]